MALAALNAPDFVSAMSRLRRRILRIAIWTCQLLLAAVFLAHGVMFLVPPPDIARLMNAALPRWFQQFLGVAEVLAAIGLTVPALTRGYPRLMVWAAGGTMIVLTSATIFHLARREAGSALATLVLLGVATAVAIARRRD
jgi:DoxX-like family